MELELSKIKQNLKASQDRYKSYVNQNLVCREFNIEDHVYLNVRRGKSYFKVGSFAKLSPGYCGSFEVLERIGPTAYISLLANSRAHNVFHVSLLKKYIYDLIHVIDSDLTQIELEGDFYEHPLCILDIKITFLWK